MKINDVPGATFRHRSRRTALLASTLFLTPLVGLLPLAPLAQAQDVTAAPAYEELLTSAAKLMVENNFVEAQLKADEAILLKPEAPEAHFAKCEIVANWYLKGNGGEAIKGLAQKLLGVFIQKFPTSAKAPDALKLLGQLHDPAAPPPPVPKLVGVSRIVDTQVNVEWEDVEGEEGYQVEASTDGVFKKVADVPANSRFVQVTLAPGSIRATLRVRSYGKGGTFSAPSAEAAVEFPQRLLDFDPSSLRSATPANALNGPGMCQLSPSGDKIALGHFKILEGTENARPVSVGDIWVLDIATGQTLLGLDGTWAFPWDGTGPRPPWIGHFGKVNAIAWEPQGNSLVSGAEDGTACLWNLKTKKGKMLEKAGEKSGIKGGIIAIHYSPARATVGPRITALSRSGVLLRWDAVTGNLDSTQVLSRQPANISCATFCPDGSKLALGTGQGEGTVMIFNASNGALMRSWFNAFGQEYNEIGAPVYVGVSAVAWTPDNENVASSSYAHIYFNNIRKPNPGTRWYISKSRVSTLAFAADGRTLAGGDGDGLFVLETDENTSMANLPRVHRIPGESARTVAFVPAAGVPGVAGESKVRVTGIGQTGSLLRWTAPLQQGTANATGVQVARD